MSSRAMRGSTGSFEASASSSTWIDDQVADCLRVVFPRGIERRVVNPEPHVAVFAGSSIEERNHDLCSGVFSSESDALDIIVFVVTKIVSDTFDDALFVVSVHSGHHQRIERARNPHEHAPSITPRQPARTISRRPPEAAARQ
jgi:hypothetical protein